MQIGGYILYVYRILTIHNIIVHNNMLPTLYRVIVREYYRRIVYR